MGDCFKAGKVAPRRLALFVRRFGSARPGDLEGPLLLGEPSSDVPVFDIFALSEADPSDPSSDLPLLSACSDFGFRPGFFADGVKIHSRFVRTHLQESPESTVVQEGKGAQGRNIRRSLFRLDNLPLTSRKAIEFLGSAIRSRRTLLVGEGREMESARFFRQ